MAVVGALRYLASLFSSGKTFVGPCRLLRVGVSDGAVNVVSTSVLVPAGDFADDDPFSAFTLFEDLFDGAEAGTSSTKITSSSSIIVAAKMNE
jgi:hypothetical protein